jgi:cytochrome c oxidase cbb3-type subunit 2
VAAAYFYFLIFGEFAFLELARAIAPAPEQLRWLMLALGAGGVLGAVAGAKWFRPKSGCRQLAWGFRACALTAVGALGVRTPAWAAVMALAVGGSLGWLTVTLASSLRGAAGRARLGLCIGAGTGAAYGCCNVPWLFQAPPAVQAAVAAGVALAGSFAPRWMFAGEVAEAKPEPDYTGGAVAGWVVALLALVWMDSAAFYTVQHVPALRADLWGGTGILAINGGVHLLAAIGAGLMLDRGVRGTLVGGAAAVLVGASLMIEGILPALVPAAWCYTAGVSLYSTVLVYYPARRGRPALAALVFAVAGWGGSALGVGMAQDLERVPPVLALGAGGVVAAGLLGRAWTFRRGALATAVAIGTTCWSEAAETDPAVAKGREVYIAEGCIHCHSQYVRARVRAEVERWGPVTELRRALDAAPPLLGNRRLGPDLANVGNRRSPEWNRLHLIAPREVSPGSRMPAYAHLFAPGEERGEALLAYLASLGAETWSERRQVIAAWRPEPPALPEAETSSRLFQRLCARCHGVEGRGDGVLAGRLSVRPPDWSIAPWRHVPPGDDLDTALARIVKFGLPGLPMAGHEYLPDGEVVGLARHVRALHPAGRRAAMAAVAP